MSLKRALLGGTYVSMSVTRILPDGSVARYEMESEEISAKTVEQMMLRTFEQMNNSLPAPVAVKRLMKGE